MKLDRFGRYKVISLIYIRGKSVGARITDGLREFVIDRSLFWQ